MLAELGANCIWGKLVPAIHILHYKLPVFICINKNENMVIFSKESNGAGGGRKSFGCVGVVTFFLL